MDIVQGTPSYTGHVVGVALAHPGFCSGFCSETESLGSMLVEAQSDFECVFCCCGAAEHSEGDLNFLLEVMEREEPAVR